MEKLPKKVAIYGGAFNPPGAHHKKIVEGILNQNLSDEVIIIPSGPRADKHMIEPHHRRNMIDLGFQKDGQIKTNYMNLEDNVFRPSFRYQEIFRHLGEIIYVIGADYLEGGTNSIILKRWENGDLLFQNSNFIIVPREGYNKENFLPPNSQVLDFKDDGSSSEIRRRLETGESLENLVIDGVLEYILKNGLYKPKK